MVQYYVYILECADNSFYVGVTNNLEKRLSEHQSDSYPKSYTHRRKPFNLVYHSVFNNVKIAILFEKK